MPRKFTHTYRKYSSDADSNRRMELARITWSNVYASGNWKAVPVTDSDVPLIHTADKLPLIGDILDFALAVSSPENLLVLTNSDVCASTNIEAALSMTSGMAYCHRHDSPVALLNPITDEQILSLPKYPGIDLFSIPAGLWKEIRHEYPAMLLGREGWDACMLEIAKSVNAVEVEGVIYHESHASAWSRPENIRSLPGQVWNRKVACEWMRSRSIEPSMYNLE